MDELNERDLFAMLAMCGALASNARLGYEEIAVNSYNMADIMMKARETTTEVGIASIKKGKL